MDKFIVDGDVAVLVSRGFGSGWSTWGQNVFEPRIVEALLKGQSETEIVDIAREIYPDAYVGGIEGLEVRWVPVGTRFRIEEYDGAETLWLENEYDWETA